LCLWWRWSWSNYFGLLKIIAKVPKLCIFFIALSEIIKIITEFSIRLISTIFCFVIIRTPM